MRLRLAIRHKILIALLLLVATVVSVITFTMANLFYDDKRTYIHDLTSVITQHTAAEVRTLLGGYQERLQVFNRLMYREDLSQQQQAELLKQLFEDFREFVGITLYENGAERLAIFDDAQLQGAGLTRDNYTRYRATHALPAWIAPGETYVENTTLSDKLPTLTLAMSHARPDGGVPDVVAAVIRLDSLQHLAQRSEVFETFIVDANNVLLSGSANIGVARGVRLDWLHDVLTAQTGKRFEMTREYERNGTEMIGGFSRIEIGGVLVGVQIPQAAAYLTARSLYRDLIWVSGGLLAVVALLGLVWSWRITRPLERLATATQALGKGDFDIQVEATSRDEIGDLAVSFNRMASELHQRDTALQQAQAQIIQSEKMSAFGQLGAGIAHEVKNPLAGILGYAQLTLRKLDDDHPLRKNIEIIEKETKRCKTIIENLMKFARQEKVEYEAFDANRAIEDAISIVDHQLSLNNVTLTKTLASGALPCMGSANQIQQVLMNLMINAQQAFHGAPGTAHVSSRATEDGHLEIRVSDNGPGIPEAIRAKIFEPFFTTKPAGKGTGLGLSVSYGIIKDHGGHIHVADEPGQGAVFVITLPGLARA